MAGVKLVNYFRFLTKSFLRAIFCLFSKPVPHLNESVPNFTKA